MRRKKAGFGCYLVRVEYYIAKTVSYFSACCAQTRELSSEATNPAYSVCNGCPHSPLIFYSFPNPSFFPFYSFPRVCKHSHRCLSPQYAKPQIPPTRPKPGTLLQIRFLPSLRSCYQFSALFAFPPTLHTPTSPQVLFSAECQASNSTHSVPSQERFSTPISSPNLWSQLPISCPFGFLCPSRNLSTNQIFLAYKLSAQ